MWKFCCKRFCKCHTISVNGVEGWAIVDVTNLTLGTIYCHARLRKARYSHFGVRTCKYVGTFVRLYKLQCVWLKFFVQRFWLKFISQCSVGATCGPRPSSYNLCFLSHNFLIVYEYINMPPSEGPLSCYDKCTTLRPLTNPKVKVTIIVCSKT